MNIISVGDLEVQPRFRCSGAKNPSVTTRLNARIPQVPTKPSDAVLEKLPDAEGPVLEKLKKVLIFASRTFTSI